MENAKPIRNRSEQSSMVSNTELPDFNTSQQAMYKSVIEAMIYLVTRTRHEMAVTASRLAPPFHEPINAQQVAVKQALCYLKETAQYEMKIKPRWQNVPWL